MRAEIPGPTTVEDIIYLLSIYYTLSSLYTLLSLKLIKHSN